MKSLPPSLSRSVASKVTPSSFMACMNTDTVLSRASATACGPGPDSSASVPLKRANAIVAILCSGSGTRSAR